MGDEEYYLGFDVGTSGIKTALIDSCGKIIAMSSKNYPSYTRKNGWHEQNPKDWWGALIETTRIVLSKSKVYPTKVNGISIGTQGLGVIPITSNGQELTPCMTWLDKRAEKQAEKIFRERGLKVSAKDPVSKILWLKENRPEIFKSTYKFVDCSGYLIMKLTGRYAWPEESAITYGYDPEKGKWKFVDYGLFPETLPEIVNANAKVAELSQNASEILGLPKEIPVFAGGSDVTVAYVGSGAIKPGSVHIYLGSSSWVCLVTKERLKSKKFHLFYSRPFGYWLNIGESESACLSLEWFRKIIFENSLKNISKQYAIITKMASKVTVGSDNLLFIPWMQGERAPISDDFARGLLFGLKLNHTKGHIFRSVMEGVAYNCRWIFEELLELYKIRKVKVIRAVGGGFLNELWCKIFADVFGLEIQVVGNPQFTGATGAALIAALGQGSYKQIEDLHLLIPASYLKRPTNKNKRIYDHLFKVFRELYWERINKIYKKLASFET